MVTGIPASTWIISGTSITRSEPSSSVTVAFVPVMLLTVPRCCSMRRVYAVSGTARARASSSATALRIGRWAGPVCSGMTPDA
jgi:hypothetical protein